MKIKKIRFSITKFFTHFFLMIGALIMGFPFFWMISSSLMGNKQIYKFPPDWIPKPVMFMNYIDGFNYLTLRSFINSFIFTFGVTVGIIFISLLSAFAFAKLKLPGKNILFMIYIASLIIPWQITIIPEFIIINKFGWVNTYQGLIVPLFGSISVATFFFRQFFLVIPEDLYDAAKIDGATIFGIFFKIYIPLSKSAIYAFGVITALNAWNMFIWPLVVTSKEDLKVLTLVLSTLTSTRVHYPMGIIMASTFLSMIPILIIYIFAQKRFVEGIATTGLKF